MINKKQILVIALVLVIIVAGVLQYTYGKSGFSSQKDQQERLGEAVYVDNMDGKLVDLAAQESESDGVTEISGNDNATGIIDSNATTLFKPGLTGNPFVASKRKSCRS